MYHFKNNNNNYNIKIKKKKKIIIIKIIIINFLVHYLYRDRYTIYNLNYLQNKTTDRRRKNRRNH